MAFFEEAGERALLPSQSPKMTRRRLLSSLGHTDPLSLVVHANDSSYLPGNV